MGAEGVRVLLLLLAFGMLWFASGMRRGIPTVAVCPPTSSESTLFDSDDNTPWFPYAAKRLRPRRFVGQGRRPQGCGPLGWN